MKVAMSFPRNVVNRLRLGRDIAARIEPIESGNLAWIYVYPVVNANNAYRDFSKSDEGIIVRKNEKNPFVGFLFRRLEVEKSEIAAIYEGIDDVILNRIIDEVNLFTELKYLEGYVSRFVADLSAFHVPEDVGYWSVFGVKTGLLEDFHLAGLASGGG